MSIPEAELKNNMEINQGFIKKQGEIRDNLKEEKEDRRKRSIRAYDVLRSNAELVHSQSQSQTQPMSQGETIDLKQKTIETTQDPKPILTSLKKISTTTSTETNIRQKRRNSYPTISNRNRNNSSQRLLS